MLEVERIILKNAALFHSTLKETGSIHLIRQFVIRATKNVNPDESWAGGKSPQGSYPPLHQEKTLQMVIWFFKNNVSTYV